MVLVLLSNFLVTSAEQAALRLPMRRLAAAPQVQKSAAQ